MFSLENFYLILYTNLLKPANIADCYFYPFGNTEVDNLMFGIHEFIFPEKNHCFFYDQEPLNIYTVRACLEKHKALVINQKRLLFANSEISGVADQICKELEFKNWYYFFHGFAALTWYRDYQYIPKFEKQFTKVFISFNRLVTKDRSYRLNLISQLKERNLLQHGAVSLILRDNGMGTWEQELSDPNTRLNPEAQERVRRVVGSLGNSLRIDSDNPPGHASADAGLHEISMYKSALWHLVTETVFYDDKRHLTEKIFKPIVAQRPFILVGAVGNLAYLKSYGFKTFDRWIDESYDLEHDNDRRLLMIVNELDKLCSLSNDELKQMHAEMQDVLMYNYQHFYGKFKEIIVDELVDNFITASNSSLNFEEARQLLKK